MITTFTPYAGLIGGTLIGLAAIILMAGNGRIAGCSGMFRQMLTLKFDNNFFCRGLFVVGIIAGTALARPFAPNALVIELPKLLPAISGGLLVGFGTALSHGCTSGHGICGISRFSLRSIVATMTFMVVGILTVYITKHVIGG